MPHKFGSKALRVLNKLCTSSPVPGVDIFAEIFETVIAGQDDGLKLEMVEDATKWIEADINSNNDHVKACALKLKDAMFANKAALESFCLRSAADKAAVARLLVAVLRCYNFANHDGEVIREFIALFRELGIEVVGQPEYCVQFATFGGLDVVNGQVVMQK